MSELDEAFEQAKRWRDEGRRVRAILLDCGLDEERKWAKPCYGHEGANLAILQRMKGFLALMFFKGALLDDPGGHLESQGEASRSARRLCFRSVDDVERLEPTIRALVASAIEVERTGQKLPEPPALELVEELQAALDADPKLKAAFEGLTPGRQRAYHLHISGAKRAETRARRVDEHRSRILAGKGLRD